MFRTELNENYFVKTIAPRPRFASLLPVARSYSILANDKAGSNQKAEEGEKGGMGERER
jgi:hypothetical protein